MNVATQMIEREAVDAGTFQREIAPAYQPVVLRGQVAKWPAVAAARQGDAATAEYLSALATERPVNVMIGPPPIKGRFFYNEAMTGFNFGRETVTIRRLITELLRLAGDPAAPALYAGATAAAEHFPGWGDANPVELPMPRAEARLWIGNATHVSTHYDASPNLACVVAGKRRFTLFPPEQLVNLYVGPFDTTIAGQPVSMVDLAAPDLDRYPRFAQAMQHALVADLLPGDAIFIPSLWWHNVRATGALNVLVNYWTERNPRELPFHAFAHALLTIRDLPEPERAAWRAWFDHYVFGDTAAQAADHLPEHAKGVLGTAGARRSDMIRQYLLRGLMNKG